MIKRRRRFREEDENPDRWVVSYADFITLLFAFFTTMYAISRVDIGKLELFAGSMKSAFNSQPSISKPVIEGITPVSPSLVNIEKEVNAAVTMLKTKEDIEVKTDKRGVIISIGDHLLFDSGNEAVKETAAEELSKIASVIEKFPNNVIVEGHTDNIPIKTERFSSNWDLSAARATSIIRYFINKEGLSPLRFSASGYGEFKPVTANTTPEGRAKNRRVEIILAKDEQNDVREQ
ncbi:MAG: OmpA family protein [Nitrospirae bacterium]|nr:OmpA family protein [Nitrospirota bacterium]